MRRLPVLARWRSAGDRRRRMHLCELAATARPAPHRSRPAQSTGAPAEATPYETTTIAAGTPTEVYALVAGGALRCWLGADGPLKATHVFHAEAAPPAEGGAAEIVLHERDPCLPGPAGPSRFPSLVCERSRGRARGHRHDQDRSPSERADGEGRRRMGEGRRGLSSSRVAPRPAAICGSGTKIREGQSAAQQPALSGHGTNCSQASVPVVLDARRTQSGQAEAIDRALPGQEFVHRQRVALAGLL